MENVASRCDSPCGSSSQCLRGEEMRQCHHIQRYDHNQCMREGFLREGSGGEVNPIESSGLLENILVEQKITKKSKGLIKPLRAL